MSSILCLMTLLAVPALRAQNETPAESPSFPNLREDRAARKPAHESGLGSLKPLSRVALSVGVSTMGLNLQAATNLNRFLNLRGVGNVFIYNIDNISTNGFDVGGKVNFATGGLSLDFYPFPNHGLRFSPGILLYNDNSITANGIVPSGDSISLNGSDYYSANTNTFTGATPIRVDAGLGLNTTKHAFTATTGWGDIISRKGGHWSFPVELGAAFVGKPAINMTLTGWACNDQAQTQCANLLSNAAIASEVQTNLNAQIAKWQNDTKALEFYPIVSFGVSYNFRIR